MAEVAWDETAVVPEQSRVPQALQAAEHSLPAPADAADALLPVQLAEEAREVRSVSEELLLAEPCQERRWEPPDALLAAARLLPVAWVALWALRALLASAVQQPERSEQAKRLEQEAPSKRAVQQQ